MTEHIHKRLIDEQARMILEKYLNKEIGVEQGMNLLGLKRRQFFKWVKKYRKNKDCFTIEYKRNEKTRGISKEIETNILNELKVEKRLIDDSAMPISFYNYSFIKDQIMKKYCQKVSLPTIIDRAKKTVFTYQDQRRSSMTMR